MAKIEDLRVGDTLEVPVEILELSSHGYIRTKVLNETQLWLTVEALEKCKHIPNVNYFVRGDVVRLTKKQLGYLEKNELFSGQIREYYKDGIVVYFYEDDGRVVVNWPKARDNVVIFANELELDNDSV